MDTLGTHSTEETRLARARALQGRLEGVLERELTALEALPPGQSALEISRSARAVSALAKAFGDVAALPEAMAPKPKPHAKAGPVQESNPPGQAEMSPDGLVRGQSYGPGGHWREPTLEEEAAARRAAKRETLRRVRILEAEGLLHTIGEAAHLFDEIPEDEQLTWPEYYAGKRAKGQID